MTAQQRSLKKLGKHRITKRHDDGDLTVRADRKTFVVTKSGRIFKEVR